jgi:hypothetical protein
VPGPDEFQKTASDMYVDRVLLMCSPARGHEFWWLHPGCGSSCGPLVGVHVVDAFGGSCSAPGQSFCPPVGGVMFWGGSSSRASLKVCVQSVHYRHSSLSCAPAVAAGGWGLFDGPPEQDAASIRWQVDRSLLLGVQCVHVCM